MRYFMLADKTRVVGKDAFQFVNAFYFDDEEEAKQALERLCERAGVPNDGDSFEVTRIYPAQLEPLTQAIKDYYNRPAHSDMEYPG